MSLASVLKEIAAEIKKPFGWLRTHGPQLQVVLRTAQEVLTEGAEIAALANEPGAAALLNQASGAITIVEGAITTATTAQTLGAFSSALTTAASALATSGDIGIKDKATQQAVAAGAAQVQKVIQTLSDAAIAAAAAPVPVAA